MPGRFGPRLDRGLGSSRELALDRVDRPQRQRKAGIYPDKQSGAGTYGGTAYPTVLEAYNRDSDYKRWRAGLDYWQGSGKSWADLERSYLVRSFRDFGALPGPQLVTVTLFPSKSASDGAWTVVTRRRGALILPQPLLPRDMSFDTSPPDPDQHRLVLDVSQTLTAVQLKEWQAFVGDQFEDSAKSGTAVGPLLEDPIDVISYTLAEVDESQKRLLFDLSRPYMRRRPNPSIPRAFWQRILYEPTRPLSWRNDGSRFLCSSHRFYCTCPDFSGMRTANLIGEATASQELFPRPTASRQLSGRWEGEVAGYRSRWRDLANRADRRRECKHIHAVRWSLGYPFYEPSDYEVGRDERLFTGDAAAPLSDEEVLRYHRLREVTLDHVVVALSSAAGIAVDTRDFLPPPAEVLASLKPEEF